MTDLRDALQTLTRDQRWTQGELTPEELWSRGVRRHRLRVAMASFLAVLAVATGAGLGSWLPGVVESAITPAGPESGPRVPRSIVQPGSSIGSTAKAGPLGQLAVAWSTDRGEGKPGVFGISATTGEYRFLDLPRLASPEQITLSPDGRHLAYWLSGSVPGKAVPGDPMPGGRSGSSWKTVVGVAVYDTVTGRTVRHEVGSRHGLDPVGLWWTDDDHVLTSYGAWLNANTARESHTFGWSVKVGQPTRLRRNVLPFSAMAPDAHGGVVYGSGSIWVEDDDFAPFEPRNERPLRLPSRSYAQVTVRGNRVVAIQTGPSPALVTSTYDWLETGTVWADGRVSALHRVGRIRANQLIGWEDSGRLLVQAFDAQGRFLLELDPDTATARRLGTIGGDRSWYDQPTFAADVVALGTADRPLPRKAQGLALTTGIGAGVALLLVIGGALLWRRRARG